MSQNLHNFRRIYEKGSLSKETVDANPLQQFKTWFYDAKEADSVNEVNAMTLTTIGLDGFPKGRVVLLKQYDENGFYFFTNYHSEKGKAIEENPKVSLSFFWPALERQVIIKGIASKTTEDFSANYFNSRPKGSQLGALVSNQSEVVENRTVLDDRLKDLEKEFQDKVITRPKFWGGYLVSPLSIEFWQGRPNRLHDRILYTLEDFDWKIDRLEP
ncbi:MAG: pyridoxamine 5'-phosphate oxidase [Flavobacterium sp.]|nr:MAG: pyridoxamine 5'-phosphate oxidase [Flavobacterium sp.]